MGSEFDRTPGRQDVHLALFEEGVGCTTQPAQERNGTEEDVVSIERSTGNAAGPGTVFRDEPEQRATLDSMAEWLARGAIAAARRAIIAR